MTWARGLAGVLLALAAGGCAAARPQAPAPARRPGTGARPCTRPVRLSPGAIVAGWRMGAVAFSSAEDGVGVTAAEVWCAVPLGKAGVEPLQIPQTVLLAVTRDGGARWTTVGAPPPGATLPRAAGGASEQVVAASARRVWLLSAGGEVLATRNGGASWSAPAAPRGAVQMALERGRLWVLACPPVRSQRVRCRLRLSRLGLASGRWTRLALPRRYAIGGPSVAAFGDTAVLYTAQDTAPPAPLLASHDGGRRWTRVALPEWNGRPCPVPAGFAAAGARTWWFLCIGGAAAGSSTKALFATRDGGRSWRIMSQVDRLGAPERPGQISVAEPGELAPASPDRLWLTLTNGIAVSDDGGAAWRGVPIREVDPQGAATVLDVLDPAHAWLLAPGAGLWRTADGVHWHALGPLNTP